MINPEHCIGTMTKGGFYRVRESGKGVIVSDPFQVDGSVMTFLADDKSICQFELPDLAEMVNRPDLFRSRLMEQGFRIAAGDVAMEVLVTALIFPEAITFLVV